MTFVAHNSPQSATETESDPLPSHPFFPEVIIADFRTAMRVDSVTTTDRAHHALFMAMLEVNGRLAEWGMAQQKDGIESLEDTTPKFGQPVDAIKQLYLRAVWSLAKANLVERYRDYDTTRAGHDQADSVEETVGDYRRDASWAINDILGIPRTTVELI